MVVEHATGQQKEIPRNDAKFLELPKLVEKFVVNVDEIKGTLDFQKVLNIFRNISAKLHVQII